MGIRKLRDCNTVSLLKYIWFLFTDRESLWCRWIHSYFLKNDNFWNSSTPTTCSWAWKKILQLRRHFRLSFFWKIGHDSSVSLWHDNWLECGPLLLLIPPDLVESRRLPSYSVVADLYSPVGASLRESLANMGITIPILFTDSNRFTWQEDPSCSFSVASAWKYIMVKKNRVSWAPLIWDNDLAPRFQFHLWLLAKNRLPTQTLLLSYGRIEFSVCAFCCSVSDSVDHLFFQCTTSTTLAFFWASRCNLLWKNRVWKDNLSWALKFLSGKDFFHSIARFSFGALCHFIWKKRNSIIFRGDSLAIPAMKNHLIKVVKDKAILFSNVPPTPRNKRLQRSWGFDPSIFSSASSS